MLNTIRTLLLALTLCLGLAACGGGDKTVDAFISDYEKMVVSMEAKAGGKVTQADMEALGKQATELGQKAASMQTAKAWNQDQVKRYTDLSKRYAEATTKMMSNLAK